MDLATGMMSLYALPLWYRLRVLCQHTPCFPAKIGLVYSSGMMAFVPLRCIHEGLRRPYLALAPLHRPVKPGPRPGDLEMIVAACTVSFLSPCNVMARWYHWSSPGLWQNQHMGCRGSDGPVALQFGTVVTGAESDADQDPGLGRRITSTSASCGRDVDF